MAWDTLLESIFQVHDNDTGVTEACTTSTPVLRRCMPLFIESAITDLSEASIGKSWEITGILGVMHQAVPQQLPHSAVGECCGAHLPLNHPWLVCRVMMLRFLCGFHVVQ